MHGVAFPGWLAEVLRSKLYIDEKGGPLKAHSQLLHVISEFLPGQNFALSTGGCT